MKTLVKHKIAKIKYTKKDGTSSNREIIPTSIPGNLSALDVSDMDGDTREILLTRLSEYAEFTEEVMKNMMTFQAWMEVTHSKQPVDGIKWRTFIPENVSNQ